LLRRGVFLDRDGTIIKDKVYLRDPGGVEILPGVGDAIGFLNSIGLPVIVVTNQSGIARGYLSEERLAMIHERLRYLLKRQGARLDAIYYCPHLPEGILPEYRLDCPCRKPGPGMLKKAAERFGLRLEECYMVGDKDIDMETIHRVGGKGILLSDSTDLGVGSRAEYIAKDLEDAVGWIVRDLQI